MCPPCVAARLCNQCCRCIGVTAKCPSEYKVFDLAGCNTIPSNLREMISCGMQFFQKHHALQGLLVDRNYQFQARGINVVTSVAQRDVQRGQCKAVRVT